jgi:hypothetical protein
MNYGYVFLRIFSSVTLRNACLLPQLSRTSSISSFSIGDDIEPDPGPDDSKSHAPDDSAAAPNRPPPNDRPSGPPKESVAADPSIQGDEYAAAKEYEDQVALSLQYDINAASKRGRVMSQMSDEAAEARDMAYEAPTSSVSSRGNSSTTSLPRTKRDCTHEK